METQEQIEIKNKVAKLPTDMQKKALDYIDDLLEQLEEDSIEKKKEAAKKRIGYFPKGSIIMNDDFDEPLDCFKEYM